MDRVDDFRKALDRAATTLLRPPAVVRYDDSVNAVPYGELRVLTGLETLEHESHLRDVSEPPHELPGEPGREQGHSAEVEAIEHRLAAKIAGPAGLVAARALPRITLREPRLGLGVTAHRKIHREDEHRAARPLGSLHQRLRDSPRVCGIELIPDRSSPGGRDVL